MIAPFAFVGSFALIARAEELRIAREAPIKVATKAAAQRAMLRAENGTVPGERTIAAHWVAALVSIGRVSPSADFPGEPKRIAAALKKAGLPTRNAAGAKKRTRRAHAQRVTTCALDMWEARRAAEVLS